VVAYLSEDIGIIPGSLSNKLLHRANDAACDAFGDILRVTSLLATEQALHETLGMRLIPFSAEQGQVTIQKRIQLRLQPSQLFPVHGLAPTRFTEQSFTAGLVQNSRFA
jgi:hypothetical protein